VLLGALDELVGPRSAVGLEPGERLMLARAIVPAPAVAGDIAHQSGEQLAGVVVAFGHAPGLRQAEERLQGFLHRVEGVVR